MREDVFEVPAEKPEKHEVEEHHAHEASDCVILIYAIPIGELSASGGAFKRTKIISDEVNPNRRSNRGQVLVNCGDIRVHEESRHEVKKPVDDISDDDGIPRAREDRL